MDDKTRQSDRNVQPSRRRVLLGAGAIGAGIVAGATGATGAGAANGSARPAWLSRQGSKPTDGDWYALRRKLAGTLILPGARAYNPARVMFDPRFSYLAPAAFAYCKNATDVAHCVDFASSFSQLPLRARSGGHSYEGWSSVNDGLVIDVSDMDSFKMGNGTVTVGSGIDLINFYSGLASHGKAVPGGSCPTVGIAGLALGGGIGVLSRIYGLTSDNIKSLEIVTADGSILTCDSTRNSDLYWASRGGGGGNFGVVTSFTFRTHDLTDVVLFFLSWPWSQAARVVSAWQSWAPHAPNALWSNMHLSAATGGPPSIGVGGTYVGSVAGAQAELSNLYALVGTGPSSSSVAANSFLTAMLIEAGCYGLPVPACDTPPGGSLPHVPYYAKSDFFSKPLDSSGLSALIAGIEQLGSVAGASGGNGSISFDALGGAVNAIGETDTAFVHRDALWVSQYYTGWNWPGSRSGRANQYNWMTSFYDSLHPHANGQAYQNYVDSALKDWQRAYYGVNYPRLQEVKAARDPRRLFDFPQAIQAM
jgi:hypothetical protein